MALAVGLAVWGGPHEPLLAQLVTSTTTLKNASTGNPLGGSVSLTGALATGNPDDEPVSMLGPIIRMEVAYAVRGLFPPDVFLRAQGALTSGSDSLALSKLSWDGVGIDASGSTWTATGSTAMPQNQAIATSYAQFGRSPMLEATFFYDQRFKLANSWLTPHGSYATTMSWGVSEGGGAPEPHDLAVAIDIPAWVALGVPTTTFDMVADPMEPAPTTSAVTATVKSNARSSETTRLKVRATALTNGTQTLPFSAYTYQLGTGSPVALSTTDQAVGAFTGATAGQSYSLTYRLAPSWAYVPGTYASTITYTAEHVPGAAAPRTASATTVNVEVPARLWIGVHTNAVNLVADPGDVGPQNVAEGAAAITVRSNYGQARLYVSATAPTDGTTVLPVSTLQYRVSSATPPTGGTGVTATVGVTQGASWTAFDTASAAIATLTGRTDGAVLTYDYQAQRSWLVPGSSYASTITYTVAGL